MSSKKSSSRSGCKCQCFSFRSLTILAVILALVSAFFAYLDRHLESFYIFDPAHLHDLSQRAISAHGNDTRAVVNYIVAELDQKLDGKYLSKQEEWVFNNAGGAMGAMYIVHASEFSLFLLLLLLSFFPFRIGTQRKLHVYACRGSEEKK